MIRNPRPLVAASSSTATMLLHAPAMQIRMPVRIPGSAERIWTCSSAYRLVAPRVSAQSRRSSGTSSSAATVVTAITGITPTMIRTSLGSSPMPSQTMNSGMKASGGSGRMTSMTGSTRWRTTREADIAAPAANADRHARHEADEDPAQADVQVEPERLALGRVRPAQVVHELRHGLADRRQRDLVAENDRGDLPHGQQAGQARRPGGQPPEPGPPGGLPVGQELSTLGQIVAAAGFLAGRCPGVEHAGCAERTVIPARHYALPFG